MRPRKRFGQHFLEPQWVAKLLAAIQPRPNDRFIEIGTGRGEITEPLKVGEGGLIRFTCKVR